jgi:hypothetical protein
MGHLERGPYWLNGMVSLAAQLNASKDSDGLKVDINKQVHKYINYILDTQNATTGWLGPDHVHDGSAMYWPGWNVASALLQFADAHAKSNPTVAARCNKAVLEYVREAARRMHTVKLAGWSQNRWQDWVYILHWLMDQAPQGEEQMLWDAADIAHEQRWDWDRYYERDPTYAHQFPLSNVGGWTMQDHGVNNAMGTKSGAVWYRQSGNASDAAQSALRLRMQDQYHGQPHGMFSADEVMGGRNLNRGIELCAVVEQMYSLQHIFRVQGDLSFIDRCEKIGYNALPATISPNMWAHQYLQQANEINAQKTPFHVWVSSE